MKLHLAITSAATLAFTAAALSEPIGEVDTAFKLFGPDHKVVVDAHDDPAVGGVTCYVSRAKTGGIKGAVGLAEDRAEASIACRQVGPITISQPLKRQEEMFSERISLVFKRLRVVRMVDSRQCAGVPDVLGAVDRRLATEQRQRRAGGPVARHPGVTMKALWVRAYSPVRTMPLLE
jgi:CreA protein